MKSSSVFLTGLILMLGFFVMAQTDRQTLQDKVDALSDRKYSVINLNKANDLLPIVRENGRPDLVFDLLNWLIDYHTDVGNYEQAMEFCGEANAVAQKANDPENILNGEMNLGNLYYRMRNFEQSINTFQPLANKLRAQGDSLGAGKIESSIAINYISLNKLDTALQLLLTARATLEKHGSPSDVLKVDQNLGNTYAVMDKPELALPYIQQSLTTRLSEQDTFSFAPAYGNLAYTLQKLGDFDRALTYYDSSLYYSRLLEQDAITYVTFQDISDGYSSIGDYENALKYFRDYHSVQEKVLGENTRNRIAELEVMHQTEQQKLALAASEQKVLTLEQEAQIHHQRLIIFTIGLFFSLLVALLIYRQWTRDHHYSETEKKLIATELTNERLTSALLNTRLENKQEDLTNFALDIERKNKFSKELIDRLEALRKVLPSSLRPQLNELISFTYGHEQLNDHLEIVQENVDQVNHEFRQKLKEAFPNLTSSDRKLAGLLRLNMTNKEVANNRGISTASAKMARYRLRKKLNLKPSDDINAFLQNL